MSVTADPRPTHRSALKSCCPCNESRSGPESGEAQTAGWNGTRFLSPVTQGLANVCCLHLVSTVPGVNLASGHSTRHAHHFPPAEHVRPVETKAAEVLEGVALWTRRHHLFLGSWGRSGEPLTLWARRPHLLSVKCWPSRGCGPGVGLPF